MSDTRRGDFGDRSPSNSTKTSPPGAFHRPPAGRSGGASLIASPNQQSLDSNHNGYLLPTAASSCRADQLHDYSSRPDAQKDRDGDRINPSTPSEQARIRLRPSDSAYFSSVHWAAVLDSASGLKNQQEKEEEEQNRDRSSELVCSEAVLGPRLLYEPVGASREDIIASIPARPVVDRMVARYFNVHGVTPGLLSKLLSNVLCEISPNEYISSHHTQWRISSSGTAPAAQPQAQS